MEIVRITHPTLEEFRAAAEVCELRWSYLRPMHTDTRFRGFQALGVELVVAREGERMDGVCFVLPCRYTFGGETIEWVSLFQLATRPETKNIGALLMMRMMAMYPAIINMGVTADATRMYVALRWKCHEPVWRGVHPLDLGRMAVDYSDRLQSRWLRLSLPALSFLYGAVARVAEFCLSLGTSMTRRTGSLDGEKLDVVASYFRVSQTGGGVAAVDAMGIGRVLNTAAGGWGTIGDHARLWRELRSTNTKFCELLIPGPAWKSRAKWLGYYPVPMPVWYVERNGMVTRWLAVFGRGEVSFLHNDKSI